jgi:hypothetical protein
MKKKPKLLDGAQNFCGPVGEKIRARIRAYLAAPTEDGWSDIAGVIITPSVSCGSLLEWVQVVDNPTLPKIEPHYDPLLNKLTGWPRIPDPVLIARAIRAALRSLGSTEPEQNKTRQK